MSSGNRRASLRSSVRGKRDTSQSLSPSRASPRRGRGGRRGMQDKSQPKINESLKANRRGGRNPVPKGRLGKRKQEEEEDITEDVSIEENESDVESVSPKVDLGLGQSVEVEEIKKSDEKPVKVKAKACSSEKLSKDEELGMLRDFDLNGIYGACRGISRMERYERAIKYSLQPPPLPLLADILRKHPQDFEYNTCIWDQNDLLRSGVRK